MIVPALKYIYFIDVFDSEVKESISTQTLYNETVSNFKFVDENVNHRIIQLNSKEELMQEFDLISNEIEYDSFTLIHLSIHGSSELNGVISTNGELITWEELKEKTRSINIKTKDRLFLILASCFGKYIGEQIDLKNKSPFRAIIASKYEVYSKDIYKIFHEFYQSLLFNNNIIKAFDPISKIQTLFFYTDTYIALKKGFEQILQKRAEDLPKLYQEYLSYAPQPHLTFFEYKKISDSTIPEILNKLEKEFII